MRDRPLARVRSGGRSALVAGVAVAASVAAFTLSELAIVALVAALGALWAFGVLASSCGAISALIAFAFEVEEGRRGLPRFVTHARAWINRNLEAAERRSRRLAHLSEAAAFIVLSVTAGPFLTTVAVKLHGGSPRTGYLLCIASSVLFSAVWVVVYASGLAVIGGAFGD